MAGEEFAPVGETIMGTAMRVHSVLGPGLLENAYELCLVREQRKAGLKVTRQTALPTVYDGLRMEAGYPPGYLINFNVVHMRDGIKRVINPLLLSSDPSASSV